MSAKFENGLALYVEPWSPYEIALRFCMEQLLVCVRRHEGQAGRLVHVVFKSRGRNEDAELELEFRRIVANQAMWGYRAPDFSYARFEPVFARKDANAAGLQLADLKVRFAAAWWRRKYPHFDYSS